MYSINTHSRSILVSVLLAEKRLSVIRTDMSSADEMFTVITAILGWFTMLHTLWLRLLSTNDMTGTTAEFTDY